MMKLSEAPVWMFRPRHLTRKRIVLALAVAAVADAVQMLAGPAGWLFFDEAIDVIAMALCVPLLGFHWLLLPTFVVKSVPVVEMIPTWTGCVIAIIALRRRQERAIEA